MCIFNDIFMSIEVISDLSAQLIPQIVGMTTPHNLQNIFTTYKHITCDTFSSI